MDSQPPCTMFDPVNLLERTPELPTHIEQLESPLVGDRGRSASRSLQRSPDTSPSLLPAADTIWTNRGYLDCGRAPNRSLDDSRDRLQERLDIERPRSALHSGNFTPQDSPCTRKLGRLREGAFQFKEPNSPWIATSPPRDFFDLTHGKGAFASGISSLSSSATSSFVYRPPTSPLVQSQSNEDLDLDLHLPMHHINIATGSARGGRRHSLDLPNSLQIATPHKQIPTRHEGFVPYQAHQPKRSGPSSRSFSLTGFSQVPTLRSRRPSFSSEASPRQHASMLGSYEESILRGCMSTNPSKPLEFMAQIGVLGLGDCTSRLRCPSHVTLPLAAVYYSYPSTGEGRSKMEDGPSPYVGQIDLENGLRSANEGQRLKRKQHRRQSDKKAAEESTAPGRLATHLENDPRNTSRVQRCPKSPRSPKAPPGGRYRIPKKGQLQIIIKNQNKTAVKLFLVPYDLVGMEAGTKTFIRQRIYSAGPVMARSDMPDVEEKDGHRPILRYLVHLHICSPCEGRYYLYRCIRLVFANRVPDGKEKLHSEMTYPEPRYTPYKPVRVMHLLCHGGPAGMPAPQQASGRCSSGVASAHLRRFHVPKFAPSLSIFDQSSHLNSSSSGTMTGKTSSEAIIFATSQREGPVERKLLASPDSQVGSYGKLSKGDVGYGGNMGAGRLGQTEGLLSRRLKSLGAQGSASEQS